MFQHVKKLKFKSTSHLGFYMFSMFIPNGMLFEQIHMRQMWSSMVLNVCELNFIQFVFGSFGRCCRAYGLDILKRLHMKVKTWLGASCLTF